MEMTEKYFEQGVDSWIGRIYSSQHDKRVIEKHREDFGEYIVGRYKKDRNALEKTLGLSFDSNTLLEWDNENNYFSFRDLSFPKLRREEGKIRIAINPCIGKPTTKVFVIPMRNMSQKECGDFKTLYAEFYTESVGVASHVIEHISNRYFSYLNDWIQKQEKGVVFNQDDKYYNLFCHVKSLCADHGLEEELSSLVRDITNGTPVAMERVFYFLESMLACNKLFGKDWSFDKYKIFGQVSKKEEFSERYNAPRGIFGFYGDEMTGHLIGITTCLPHLLTVDIIIDIIKNS